MYTFFSIFSSYNGPFAESANNDQIVLSGSNTLQNLLHKTNSVKKQRVYRLNESALSKGDNLRSIKDRPFTPQKQPFFRGDIFNAMTLTASPSSHRRPAVIPKPFPALSHHIQTTVIPSGSTTTNASATQLLTLSKQLTPDLFGHNNIV